MLKAHIYRYLLDKIPYVHSESSSMGRHGRMLIAIDKIVLENIESFEEVRLYKTDFWEAVLIHKTTGSVMIHETGWSPVLALAALSVKLDQRK